jgi:phospholipase C
MRHALCSGLARALENLWHWIVSGVLIIAVGTCGSDAHSADRENATKTTTPIKHLIVVIAENRSFDHLFGVYRPRRVQRIDNLLSRGIVNEDGSHEFS